MAPNGPLSVVQAIAIRIDPAVVRFRLDTATRDFGMRGAWSIDRMPADALVALNTAMLLFSSITYGFAMIAAEQGKKGATLRWLAITGVFGLCFLGIELYEFSHLIHEGAGPQRSAFLSSFFTLVGTHGLHVTFGIVWLVTLMVQVAKFGLGAANMRRLMCLSLFWHFLDVIWIGVFTFVYLLGVL